MHELHRVLLDAADGRFPDIDGAVEILEPIAGDHHATVEFTGHAFVLTDHDPDEVRARGADGFGGASQPDLRPRRTRPGRSFAGDAARSRSGNCHRRCMVVTRNWNTSDVVCVICSR